MCWMYACKLVCALNYVYYEEMLLFRSAREETIWVQIQGCKGMIRSLLVCHEKSHIRFTRALPVHIKISLTSDASCWNYICRTYSRHTHKFYPPAASLTHGILMSHRVGIISKKQCCHLPLFLLTHSFYS